MLIGISILISFIVVCLLIALFPLTIEKKPLYIVTGISGLVVLLSIFSAYALVWWYGIMVFAGLLLALTILVGKKMEWLKPINHAEKEIIHKPFPLEFKEAGKGRSVYDEEFRQISVAHKQKHDNLVEHIEKKQPVYQSNDVILVDESNDQLEELIIDDFPDYIEITDPIEIRDAKVPVQVIDSSILPVEPIQDPLETRDLTETVEVEELSDEWLNSRLDALYGKEQSATVDFEFEEQPLENDEFVNEPLKLEEAYSFLSDVEVESTPTLEQDVEFEDLSKLYYEEIRGENDGTTE